eukprot:4756313-Prymnesium_polylepis.1
MHIHVRPDAVGRHMQKESTRTDQTRARNDYGTCHSLTGLRGNDASVRVAHQRERRQHCPLGQRSCTRAADALPANTRPDAAAHHGPRD